jgi:hypothetical protein
MSLFDVTMPLNLVLSESILPISLGEIRDATVSARESSRFF